MAISDLRLSLAKCWRYVRANPVESAGVVAAGLGAYLISRNTDLSKWGWVAFLASNALLMCMAWSRRIWGVFILQVYFAYTSVAGINNFF